MPTYTFRNKNTNEQITLNMSISEMEEYEKNNTHMEYVWSPIAICDPVGLGITKPPSDFLKNVIGRVKEAPGAHNPAIEKRWTIPREW